MYESRSINNCIGPPYCRTKKYAGRVACCPLVSHIELSMGQTDGQTDGHQNVAALTCEIKLK